MTGRTQLDLAAMAVDLIELAGAGTQADDVLPRLAELDRGELVGLVAAMVVLAPPAEAGATWWYEFLRFRLAWKDRP